MLQIKNDISSFSLNKLKTGNQYVISFALIGLATCLCFLIRPYSHPEVAAFILLLILSVIAIYFDILPVLFSAVLSAVTWYFFCLAPGFRFFMGKPEEVIIIGMYFIIAMVSAVFTYKIRRVEKVVRHKKEIVQTYSLSDTVLNSLSHEFRTPLATIIAATDNLLLNTQNLTGQDKSSLLTEISVASLRMNQQVGNLLNMSRIESGFIKPKKTWCDVNDLVYDVLKRLDRHDGHLIRVNIREDIPLCKMDYGLIQQLVFNIINNALQHTPANSVIKVNADYLHEKLILKIQDTGNGFPEEEIGNVFKKFYRLPHSKAGGIGLGLSLAKGFVEAHDGTIELNNILPSGAEFTITIPSEKNVV